MTSAFIWRVVMCGKHNIVPILGVLQLLLKRSLGH